MAKVGGSNGEGKGQQWQRLGLVQRLHNYPTSDVIFTTSMTSPHTIPIYRHDTQPQQASPICIPEACAARTSIRQINRRFGLHRTSSAASTHSS